MKTLAILAILALAASHLSAQTETVLKNKETDALTESIVIPTGKSVTINSGASIINNGTATGFGGGGGSLDDLSDVTITTAATNDFLVRGSSAWINLTPTNARTALGLGTLATQSGTISDYLTTAAAASAYQPLDSDLTSYASSPSTALAAVINGSSAISGMALVDKIAVIPATGPFQGTLRTSTLTNLVDLLDSVLAPLSGTLAQFASTTSSELAGVISNETGSGALVFATSPTLVTPALGTPSSGTMTNVSGTAASLTAGAANGLKTATTTVAVSSATAPTSGQVLTATSSTAATWQTPSGGGGGSANWTLMSTTTLAEDSSVTLALDGYRRYQIEFEDVRCSFDGYTLQMQVSNDAGSTWNTGASDYDWGASKVGSYTDASGTGAFIRLTYLTGNGTGEGISGVLTVLGANDPALQFRVLGKLMEPAYNSASVFGWDIVGRRAATSDVDAVKIYFSSGTLLSGKIRVFGWSE